MIQAEAVTPVDRASAHAPVVVANDEAESR